MIFSYFIDTITFIKSYFRFLSLLILPLMPLFSFFVAASFAFLSIISSLFFMSLFSSPLIFSIIFIIILADIIFFFRLAAIFFRLRHAAFITILLLASLAMPLFLHMMLFLSFHFRHWYYYALPFRAIFDISPLRHFFAPIAEAAMSQLLRWCQRWAGFQRCQRRCLAMPDIGDAISVA